MLAAACLVPCQIEHQVPYAELVLVVFPGATAKCANPREQLLEGEWLSQVIVSAGVEAANTVGHGVAGGQHQNWRLEALSTQLAGYFDAVHLGEHHIQDDQIVGAALSAGQSLQAIVRNFDVVANIG